MKPTQAFLVALVVVLLGLFLPGWIGAVVMLAMAGALLALMAATWRSLRPGTAAVRFVIIAGIVVVAVLKAIWQ